MFKIVLVIFGNIECGFEREEIVPIKSESRSEKFERVSE
jgi:hypothetical protein